MNKRIYFVKPVKKGWVIERPDGSYVNDNVFKDKVSATKHLKTLVALGYANDAPPTQTKNRSNDE